MNDLEGGDRRVASFDHPGPERDGRHRPAQRGHGGLGQHGLPGRGELLQPLRQVHRVTDQGVFQPFGRAEQCGGGLATRQPQAEAERREAVGAPAVVDPSLQGVHDRCGGHRPVGVIRLRERRAEHRHDRVPHELHHRSPLTQDGVIHRGPVGIQLAGELARVGVLGDGRVGPDVAHQHGHDDALGLADLPVLLAQLLRQPAGQQPGQRLALLLPVHDGPVQQAEPLQRAGVARRHSLGQLDEDRLDFGVDGFRGRPARHGDGLDRLPLRDHAEQFFLGRCEAAG